MTNEAEPRQEKMAQSSVTVFFPNGPHTTDAQMQLSNVDTAQIEIAANFLKRIVDDQYSKANLRVESRSPIVPPPPGFKV